MSKNTKVYKYMEGGKNDTEAEYDLSKYKYINNNGKEQYMVVLDNSINNIIKKVYKENNMMNNNVLQYSPFGLVSNFEDSDVQDIDKYIKVMKAKKNVTYTNIDSIKQNRGIIGNYKVICSRYHTRWWRI